MATVPTQVIDLVERFARNRDAYLAGGINEPHLRRGFIDLFFSCLGLDIENKQGYAPAYREVVFEDSLKVGGGTKAPDHSFRIGGSPKFFVEAKKPSVNIATDVAPAYQLRRYAWSAKLPLSILAELHPPKSPYAFSVIADSVHSSWFVVPGTEDRKPGTKNREPGTDEVIHLTPGLCRRCNRHIDSCSQLDYSTAQ